MPNLQSCGLRAICSGVAMSVAGVRLRVVKSGRRFRVELTEGQARLAEQTADVCRAVWNTGLRAAPRLPPWAWMNYRRAGWPSSLRPKPTIRGWARCRGHCLQQTLMDLDKACRLKRGTFKVRWRSGRRWAPSFRFPEGTKMVVRTAQRPACRG